MSYHIEIDPELPGMVTTFTDKIDFEDIKLWADEAAIKLRPFDEEPVIYNICDISSSTIHLGTLVRGYPVLANHAYFQARIAAGKENLPIFIGQNPMAEIMITLAKRINLNVPLFRDMATAMAYINHRKTHTIQPQTE